MTEPTKEQAEERYYDEFKKYLNGLYGSDYSSKEIDSHFYGEFRSFVFACKARESEIESIRGHLLAQCKISNKLLDEKETLKEQLAAEVKQREKAENALRDIVTVAVFGRDNFLKIEKLISEYFSEKTKPEQRKEG